MVATSLLVGVLALSIPFAACAPTAKPDDNRVTITITNDLDDNSAITDTQNNGHINVINGGKDKSTISDDSSNAASSSNVKLIRDAGNSDEGSESSSIIVIPIHPPQPKEQPNTKPTDTAGDQNTVTVEVSQKLNGGSIETDTQNNNHINIVNGGKATQNIKDNSTNTAVSAAQAAPVEPAHIRDGVPVRIPLEATSVCRRAADTDSNNVDITLDMGLKSGSNSTGSMNNNEIEVYIPGRPEGLNITIHFSGDKDSSFVDSGNGNKIRIIVEPVA